MRAAPTPIEIVIMSKQHDKKSKFLSYVLRHSPESIGLTLDASGWAVIDALLARLAATGPGMNRATLMEIVAADAKQRYTISEDGLRIRAAQGHSIKVDLAISPVEPPETLYHGTAMGFVLSIRAEGLKPGGRQQVHLSADVATARAVGRRHGSPVVLLVASGEMHRNGHAFFRADNGVWLTDAVPPEFLKIPE
jgi:putative RNA 2'-phosphotransferase